MFHEGSRLGSSKYWVNKDEAGQKITSTLQKFSYSVTSDRDRTHSYLFGVKCQSVKLRY